MLSHSLLKSASRPLSASRAYSAAAPLATPPPQNTVRYPYYVPRNSRGSLPVYTDIRNGGSRFLISVRNVQGNVDALVHDLTRSLFPQGSPEAERIKVYALRSKHVVLSGGRWKHDIVEWLKGKGF